MQWKISAHKDLVCKGPGRNMLIDFYIELTLPHSVPSAYFIRF
jgi:hypothetical protein